MQTKQANPAMAGDQSTPLTHTAVQLAGAALIGLAIVYGVGFSHIMPVHNAAHDVRHSAAFPCH